MFGNAIHSGKIGLSAIAKIHIIGNLMNFQIASIL
jgi:hypothetical protein